MPDAKGNSVSLKEEIIWAKRQPLHAKVIWLHDNKPNINIQDKTIDEKCTQNRLNEQLGFAQN